MADNGGILENAKGICYNVYRQKDRNVHWTQRKPPEVRTPGAFFAVLGGWLRPKAGYQFLSSSNHLQI